MRQKHFPVGVAQGKVLEALGLKAGHFDHAEAIFARIGISVHAKRVGRMSEPLVYLRATAGGAFNQYGEGETWEIPVEPVDLTPIQQWMA